MVVGMNLVIVFTTVGHQLSIRAMGKALMGHEHWPMKLFVI